MAFKSSLETSQLSNDSLTNDSSINAGIIPSKYSLIESGVNYKKCSLVSKISSTNYSSKKSLSCSKRSIKSSTITSSIFITIVFILIIQSTLNINYYANCHPVSSLHMCHGLQQGSRYTYKYDTLMLLNNHDHKVSIYLENYLPRKLFTSKNFLSRKIFYHEKYFFLELIHELILIFSREKNQWGLDTRDIFPLKMYGKMRKISCSKSLLPNLMMVDILLLGKVRS